MTENKDKEETKTVSMVELDLVLGTLEQAKARLLEAKIDLVVKPQEIKEDGNNKE